MRKIDGIGLHRALLTAASSMILGISCSSAVAANRGPGVWCERGSDCPMTEHERRLAASLRRITGFCDVRFAPDGSLSVGDFSAAAGGSAEARQLLVRVLRSGMTFVIEDHSGSGAVNFGQILREEILQDREKSSEVWRVQLDFEDFRQMDASREVRAAFDEGFTLLHELLHGLGYKDAFRMRELGECEEIVNRMRSELGLPLRDEYFGEAWRMTEKITSVRMRFRNRTPTGKGTRWQSHYLFFVLNQSIESSPIIRSVTRVDKPSRN